MRMIDEGEHENEHENTAQHSTAQYRSTRRMNNEWMNTHDGEDENDEDDDEDEDDKEADRHEQPNTQTHKTGLGYPPFSFFSVSARGCRARGRRRGGDDVAARGGRARGRRRGSTPPNQTFGFMQWMSTPSQPHDPPACTRPSPLRPAPGLVFFRHVSWSTRTRAGGPWT